MASLWGDKSTDVPLHGDHDHPPYDPREPVQSSIQVPYTLHYPNEGFHEPDFDKIPRVGRLPWRKVYSGNVELKAVEGDARGFAPEDSLEKIFEVHNIEHPADFKNRSLSVGDIVSIPEGHYMVKGAGWAKVDPKHYGVTEGVMDKKPKQGPVGKIGDTVFSWALAKILKGMTREGVLDEMIEAFLTPVGLVGSTDGDSASSTGAGRLATKAARSGQTVRHSRLPSDWTHPTDPREPGGYARTIGTRRMKPTDNLRQASRAIDAMMTQEDEEPLSRVKNWIGKEKEVASEDPEGELKEIGKKASVGEESDSDTSYSTAPAEISRAGHFGDVNVSTLPRVGVDSVKGRCSICATSGQWKKDSLNGSLYCDRCRAFGLNESSPFPWDAVAKMARQGSKVKVKLPDGTKIKVKPGDSKDSKESLDEAWLPSGDVAGPWLKYQDGYVADRSDLGGTPFHPKTKRDINHGALSAVKDHEGDLTHWTGSIDGVKLTIFNDSIVDGAQALFAEKGVGGYKGPSLLHDPDSPTAGRPWAGSDSDSMSQYDPRNSQRTISRFADTGKPNRSIGPDPGKHGSVFDRPKNKVPTKEQERQLGWVHDAMRDGTNFVGRTFAADEHQKFTVKRVTLEKALIHGISPWSQYGESTWVPLHELASGLLTGSLVESQDPIETWTPFSERFQPGDSVQTPEGVGIVVEETEDFVSVQIGRMISHYAPDEITLLGPPLTYEPESKQEPVQPLRGAKAILEERLFAEAADLRDWKWVGVDKKSNKAILVCRECGEKIVGSVGAQTHQHMSQQIPASIAAKSALSYSEIPKELPTAESLVGRLVHVEDTVVRVLQALSEDSMIVEYANGRHGVIRTSQIQEADAEDSKPDTDDDDASPSQKSKPRSAVTSKKGDDEDDDKTKDVKPPAGEQFLEPPDPDHVKAAIASGMAELPGVLSGVRAVLDQAGYALPGQGYHIRAALDNILASVNSVRAMMQASSPSSPFSPTGT